MLIENIVDNRYTLIGSNLAYKVDDNGWIELICDLSKVAKIYSTSEKHYVISTNGSKYRPFLEFKHLQLRFNIFSNEELLDLRSLNQNLSGTYRKIGNNLYSKPFGKHYVKIKFDPLKEIGLSKKGNIKVGRQMDNAVFQTGI